MKYLLSIVLLFLLIPAIHSQVITDKTVHDFGEVTEKDEKYTDFKFTNASRETIRIERVEEPYGISVRFSAQSIPPDSSVFVRIKYTPKRKGEFVSDVPVWVSSNSQPIVLTVKGKALSFDSKESLEAPPFANNGPSSSAGSLKITVVEKGSGKPIDNARIDIVWDGVIYKSLRTNEEGKTDQTLKNDAYYIIASAPGYSSAETDVDLTEEPRQLLIELGPETGEIIAEVPEETALPPDTSGQALQDELSPADTSAVAIEEPPVITVDTIVPEPDSLPPPPEPEIVITSADLPEDKYASNNIVFLIDVSVSMKHNGKLDLLKASMIELASLLRESDKLAIVTYSSQTNLVLESVSAGNNKEKIIDVIKGLEAAGSTSGTKGIRKAYSVLNSNYIDNGNNQIFISTDGAFNIEKKDKKLLKIVKRNAKKGNKISVLGIKNSKWTVENMEAIAREGNGNYIHIENYNNARSGLVEEIKKQSFKD